MPAGVEWLDEPPRLPTESSAHGRRRPRRRLAAILALLVVVAGLVVALRSLLRPGDPATAQTVPLALCDAMTRTTEIPPLGANKVFVVLVPDPGVVTSGPVRCTARPAQCPNGEPGQPGCDVSPSVPAAVVRAVHAHLRQAQVVQARTETLARSGKLWFRYLRIQLPGDVTVGVEIAQGHADDQPAGQWRDGKSIFGRAVAVRGDTRVLVTVERPRGSPSLVAAQRALAADQRLSGL